MRCENSTLLHTKWPQILYMLILLTPGISISNAQCYIYIYVGVVDTKTHPHISAYNFLNIQLIFNLQKVWKAETEGFSTIPSNTIYVDTVDTRHKYF